MILWKIWYDLRLRFWIFLGLVILNILLLITIFPVAPTFASWIKAEIPQGDWSQVKKIISSYRLFIDHGWFREVKYFSMFAVILSLGGVMAERKTRSIYLTLSLPVSRRRWLLFHSGMVLLLIAIICGISALLVLVGGIAYESGYPFLRALQGALFLTLIALPWIGLTFAVASLAQDKLRTALIVFCIWFFMGILNAIPPVRLWLPRHLMDYFLTATSFPWQSLLVIFTAGIGGILFAIHRFEKEDY